MNLKIKIEKTDKQCATNIITLNIPGLSIDIWLCVTAYAKFLFWSKTLNYAIHLV